jgi:hypothetical protein
MSDGSLAWDALAFVVGDDAVVLTVTAGCTPVRALGDVVGKPLGWCWVATSYRGYQDSFTLALGDVVPDALQPRLTFLGKGSSLSCFGLAPRRG